MLEPGQSLFLPSNRRAGPGCFTLAASLLLLGACTLATPSVRSASVDVVPRIIHVEPVLVRADVTPHVEDLLAAAHRSWARRQLPHALELFDRARQSAPQLPVAPWAAYWAACVAEDAEQWRDAAKRYAELLDAFPDEPLARPAAVGAVRLFTFIEEWVLAEQLARRLLDQDARLTAQERVGLHGTVALAALQSDRLPDAQRHVALGRRIAEQYKLNEAETWSRDLAQLYFAQGEVRRLNAEALTFVPPPGNFAERFEERAQAVLDAQSTYLDVMRARDAHWTSRAGLRIGELYQRLHNEVMQTPVPAAVEAGKVDLFRGAMRLRFVVLLEKGLKVLDRTWEMAQRTGERSSWVDLVQQRRTEMARALELEQAALDALPVSRADLKGVLDEIHAAQ
jgi:tetratricopeptide (TPR) repeat protein